MRFVFENRAEAKRRGMSARKYMVEHYSLEVMGRVIKSEFQRINNKLKIKESRDKSGKKLEL